jgi:hypothetical protein
MDASLNCLVPTRRTPPVNQLLLEEIAHVVASPLPALGSVQIAEHEVPDPIRSDLMSLDAAKLTKPPDVKQHLTDLAELVAAEHQFAFTN